MWYLPLVKGFMTTASLIMAIGAQNAFVLKQGLMKNQVLVTALFCSLVDAMLIGLGVAGIGALLTKSSMLLLIAKWGGATFLFWYGFKAFRAIFREQSLNVHNSAALLPPSLKETIITLVGVTFLNPHVYLDTVILLGSISSQYQLYERSFFAFGAICMTLCWFFGLCYGARLLAPFFKRKIAWKILDGFVGSTMWLIGLSLLLFKPNL